MYLHKNIKFLRNYTRTTQQQFGNLFQKSRSNIDSYERGNARPTEEFITALSNHFNISLDVLINRDLQTNPGLMFSGSSVQDQKNSSVEDLIKAKDETIKDLRQQVKYLQEQYNQLVKKLKVA